MFELQDTVMLTLWQIERILFSLQANNTENL